MQKKVQDLEDLLYEIKTSGREYSLFEANRAKNLYTLLNLMTLTEMGYSMIPPDELISSIEEKYTDSNKPKYRCNNVNSRRLIIYMWLYYLRR